VTRSARLPSCPAPRRAPTASSTRQVTSARRVGAGWLVVEGASARERVLVLRALRVSP
jgi:hypothetical protein